MVLLLSKNLDFPDDSRSESSESYPKLIECNRWTRLIFPIAVMVQVGKGPQNIANVGNVAVRTAIVFA